MIGRMILRRVVRLVIVFAVIGIIAYFQHRKDEEKREQLQKELDDLAKRPGLMQPGPTPLPSIPGPPPTGTPLLPTPAP